MAKVKVFSGVVNVVNGIIVEIAATLILMGAAFITGFLIMEWFHT